MDCPQCGGGVASYVLDGREAVVCESCGYVGIPADHHGDGPTAGESWDDALRRYHEQHPPVGRAGARVPVVPDGSRPADDESWDEALARFSRERAAVGSTADSPATRPRASDDTAVEETATVGADEAVEETSSVAGSEDEVDAGDGTGSAADADGESGHGSHATRDTAAGEDGPSDGVDC
jgi:hypothetical protein